MLSSYRSKFLGLQNSLVRRNIYILHARCLRAITLLPLAQRHSSREDACENCSVLNRDCD